MGRSRSAPLLLHQLRLPFELVRVDIERGETRTPDFLRRNPNGRIPLLELEDGRCLAESNAIQWYLAEGTELLPAERFARAEVLQWMFFEQYSHEPYIATARFILRHLPPGHERHAEVTMRRARGPPGVTCDRGP